MLPGMALGMLSLSSEAPGKRWVPAAPQNPPKSAQEREGGSSQGARSLPWGQALNEPLPER